MYNDNAMLSEKVRGVNMKSITGRVLSSVVRAVPLDLTEASFGDIKKLAVVQHWRQSGAIVSATFIKPL